MSASGGKADTCVDPALQRDDVVGRRGDKVLGVGRGFFRIPQLHIKVPAGLALCRSRGFVTPPRAAGIRCNRTVAVYSVIPNPNKKHRNIHIER